MQNYDVTLMNSAKQRHVIAQFWFEKVLNILINNLAKFVKTYRCYNKKNPYFSIFRAYDVIK